MSTVVHGVAVWLLDLLPDLSTNLTIWIIVGGLKSLVYRPTKSEHASRNIHFFGMH